MSEAARSPHAAEIAIATRAWPRDAVRPETYGQVPRGHIFSADSFASALPPLLLIVSGAVERVLGENITDIMGSGDVVGLEQLFNPNGGNKHTEVAASSVGFVTFAPNFKPEHTRAIYDAIGRRLQADNERSSVIAMNERASPGVALFFQRIARKFGVPLPQKDERRGVKLPPFVTQYTIGRFANIGREVANRALRKPPLKDIISPSDAEGSRRYCVLDTAELDRIVKEVNDKIMKLHARFLQL